MKPLKEGEVDFKHFHTYEEATMLLQKVGGRAIRTSSSCIPSASRSKAARSGRSRSRTRRPAAHTDKAAFFIEGGRHAGEITGIEATLYFVNHVLTNYGKDAAITKLVDTKTIYAKPHNNPDGASLYHYTAQTLRSTVRPKDNDGDGLFDEDAGEDLDGDGFVRQMRKFVGAGKGTAIVDKRDPKGRLMQTVGAGKGDYDLYTEGFDNDGDGRVNEDGIGGLDLHRNYPENWRPMTEATGRGYTQDGAGAYPLSEPETKAVFDFLMRHPNVGIAQSLDTSVPMILRGPSTSKSEESMFPEDLAIIKKFDQKGLEITGYPWAGDTFFIVREPRPRRRAAAAERAGTAALRPRAGVRLPLLRCDLVRQRDLERRAAAGGRRGQERHDRRRRTVQVARRESARQERFPAVDEDDPPDARRGRGRRLESEVLVAEPAARDARDLGEERSDVQPLPRAATRAGAHRVGDDQAGR